jgi:urease accessory protein
VLRVESQPPADTGGWQASLDLAFERRNGVTRLAHNRHLGPLRLIRALPGESGCCHAVIVHPPGGLVGGDRLSLSIRLGASAHVLCTTPGAQKWYRSPGASARSTTRVRVASAGVLEWLPQPAIVYDAANADQDIDFELARHARMIGWECLVLGRAAMGERFLRGSLRQRLSLHIDGRCAWAEHSHARAGDRLFASPLGWAQRTVSATVWSVGSDDASLLAGWRQAIASAVARGAIADGGATEVEPRLLIARLLADDSEAVMDAAQRLWQLARPSVAGIAPAAPRIWTT